MKERKYEHISRSKSQKTNINWTTLRNNIIKTNPNKCCKCNVFFNEKELEVDHIVPLSIGGDYKDENNLRVLCKRCHKIKSGKDRVIHNLFTKLGFIVGNSVQGWELVVPKSSLITIYSLLIMMSDRAFSEEIHTSF